VAEGDAYVISNILYGTDLLAEFIVPDGEELITPRLESLQQGVLLGPLPKHYPKKP